MFLRRGVRRACTYVRLRVSFFPSSRVPACVRRRQYSYSNKPNKRTNSKQSQVLTTHGVLDLEQLCITEGRAVWIVRCDVMILDDSGNLQVRVVVVVVAAMMVLVLTMLLSLFAVIGQQTSVPPHNATHAHCRRRSFVRSTRHHHHHHHPAFPRPVCSFSQQQQDASLCLLYTSPSPRDRG